MRSPKTTVRLGDLWVPRLLPGVGSRFNLDGLHERLSRAGTDHRKCMCSICGLARKAYVSCVSSFPCSVYIDSNHRDSQI
jgi:hypothetical protein